MTSILTNEGAEIVVRALAGQGYCLNAVYAEFCNGIAPPSVSPLPQDGRAYYAALAANGPGQNCDFLRLPISFAPGLDSTNPALYTANRLTVAGLTSGLTGVGGLPFSAGAGSVVYGWAVVAAPVLSDMTRDLVYARFYGTAVAKTDPDEIQFWLRLPVT